MQKFFKFMLVFFVLLFSVSGSAFADEKIKGDYKPFSPEFIKWQNKNLKDGSTTSTSNSSGYIPIPVDLSHLASNPPVEEAKNAKDKVTASNAPSKYDLRNFNYVTSVKDQGSYGTCWAHASIGAMESNLLKNSGAAMDLSEQHLAWFSMKNSDKSKVIFNLNSATFNKVMNNGGNAFMPTALYSRLAGPVNESEVPYGKQPSAKIPESYTRLLRLKDVFYLSDTSDYESINDSASARDSVKQRIINNGGVMASYTHNTNYYQSSSSYGTSYYSTSSSGEGHAILLIGWDDDYSASNFKINPGMNGAWLVKNSWGSDWGTDGYFWMSYKQNLTGGAAFVVEQADSDMKAYYYDALGWCATWGYSSGTSSIYAANVFKSERSETLKEIGFYTPDNNIKYEAKVYLMSSMPSSSPIKGSAVSSVSGTISTAGYHTVVLNTPIALSSGQYFSVVVKFNNYTYTAVEMVTSGFSPNAKIEEGSFFSYNGSNWETGKSAKANACIKAFTVSGSSTSAPSILTEYPPDAYLNVAYSSIITASGSTPLTWSTSGNVPSGLSINSSTGEISGTPTKAGNFTFTVKAQNSVGSDSKSFTMNVYETPKLVETEFTGYYGLDFSKKLKLSSGTALEWSISGKLPKGLTFDTGTASISGTPKQTGTFKPAITVTLSSGTVTADLNITIIKPVKPSITISKFPDGIINQEYTATLTLKGTTPITLSASGYPNGLNFNASKGVLSGTPTEAGTFTIKITAENIATEISGKAITKNLKLKINAVAPVIKTPSKLADGICGKEYSSVQFETSEGTAPITWKATGLPKGLSLSEEGLLSGTPTKAGNFNINLKASNSGGKDSLKIPLTILEAPYTTTKKLSDATADKNYSAKIVAKGTTPITWKISGLPSTLSYSTASNGANATITGTPTVNGEYSVSVTMTNSAGSSTVTFPLTVKGVKPKITGSLAAGKAESSYTGSKISVTGTKPLTISYSITEAGQKKFGISKLEDIGLKFSANSSTGAASITGTPTICFKSLPIEITASNSTGTSTKKFMFTVNGVTPSFTLPTASTITTEAGGSININVQVKGTKNITFSINKINGLTLTRTGDRTATVTGTAPSKTGKTTLKITAANATGKTTKNIVIQTTAKSSSSEKNEKSEKDTSESITFENEITSEAVINVISERNISSLSRNLISELKIKGYEIAAVLPEISVTEGGMYDFDFEIAEEIESGKKLIWLAFPDKNASEDDEISEFYDVEGAEIENVPENHIATVSAWLNEGIIYSPIIAVKGD